MRKRQGKREQRNEKRTGKREQRNEERAGKRKVEREEDERYISQTNMIHYLIKCDDYTTTWHTSHGRWSYSYFGQRVNYICKSTCFILLYRCIR